MKRISLVDIGTVVAASCAVLLTGFAISDRMGSSDSPRKDRRIADWEAIARGENRIGSSAPRVTIVEFGDYECPACKGFEKSVSATLAKYPNDVAFIYRHWPLPQHPHAYGAARVAECASRQRKFEEVHSALYAASSLDSTVLQAIIDEAPVADQPMFRSCIDNGETDSIIDADIAALSKFDPIGTPTVFVNGILLGGVPSLSKLDSLVRATASR